MHPKSRSEGLAVRESHGLFTIEHVATGETFTLDPLALRIWQNSDGNRSISELTAEARRLLQRNVTQEEVFTTLDFLADAGLLHERVTPPAGVQMVSRRGVLQIPAIALAAAVAAGLSAHPASGQTDNSKAEEQAKKAAEAKEKKSAEQNTKKSAETKAKASTGKPGPKQAPNKAAEENAKKAAEEKSKKG